MELSKGKRKPVYEAEQCERCPAFFCDDCVKKHVYEHFDRWVACDDCVPVRPAVREAQSSRVRSRDVKAYRVGALGRVSMSF